MNTEALRRPPRAKDTTSRPASSGSTHATRTTKSRSPDVRNTDGRLARGVSVPLLSKKKRSNGAHIIVHQRPVPPTAAVSDTMPERGRKCSQKQTNLGNSSTSEDSDLRVAPDLQVTRRHNDTDRRGDRSVSQGKVAPRARPVHGDAKGHGAGDLATVRLKEEMEEMKKV